jgi:hypothetical protein
MKYLCAVAVALLGVSVATTASGAVLSPSGDSCIATGKGTSYTLNITIPSATPQQFGFAFGAHGTAVTTVDLPGTTGAFSAESGPSGTTGTWITTSPVPTGSTVANLTTTTPANGAFTVVPVSSPESTFLDPITCTASAAPGKALPASSTTVSVDRQVVYDVKAHGWRLSVAISRGGTVSAIEPEATLGTSTAKSVTAKSLVQARSAGLKSRGTVTLLVKPTPAGSKALAAKGSISVKLIVTFAPSSGKSVSKTVKLTLRK